MKTLMVSLFGLCMMGCMTEGEELDSELQGPVPPEVGAPAKEDLPVSSAIGPTNTEYYLPWRGGYGGTYTGHITPAAVIYAVRVRAGDLVDNIAFGWYQPTRADNVFQTGDAYGQTGFFGGTGGTDRGWWYCPVGKGVIGIRGSAGTLLDRIGVICGDVNNPDLYNPYNTYSPLWGGGGGTWFDDRCAPGRLVDSFHVRAASVVDGLGAICISAH